MQDINIDTNNNTKIKPWHFAGGLAFSCVPLIGEIGDTALEMHNIKKLEKTPFKDTFIKAIEEKGKSLQKYSIFKGTSAKKIGAMWFGFWTLGDIILGGFVTKAILDWFSKRKNS